MSHDGSQVPLTEDATRVEAGLKTGFSGPLASSTIHETFEMRDGTMHKIVADIELGG